MVQVVRKSPPTEIVYSVDPSLRDVELYLNQTGILTHLDSIPGLDQRVRSLAAGYNAIIRDMAEFMGTETTPQMRESAVLFGALARYGDWLADEHKSGDHLGNKMLEHVRGHSNGTEPNELHGVDEMISKFEKLYPRGGNSDLYRLCEEAYAALTANGPGKGFKDHEELVRVTNIQGAYPMLALTQMIGAIRDDPEVKKFCSYVMENPGYNPFSDKSGQYSLAQLSAAQLTPLTVAQIAHAYGWLLIRGDAIHDTELDQQFGITTLATKGLYSLGLYSLQKLEADYAEFMEAVTSISGQKIVESGMFQLLKQTLFDPKKDYPKNAM
mgnify:CR=1 FL=1